MVTRKTLLFLAVRQIIEYAKPDHFRPHFIEERYGDRRTDTPDEMFACTTKVI